MVPQKDPLGILGEQPKEKKQADPLGILKKKEPLEAPSVDGGGAGISAPQLVSEKAPKGFEGLKPAKVQPVEIKEPSVGEDTVLTRKLAKAQKPAVATTEVRLPEAPIAVAEEVSAERALAPKIAPEEGVGELEGLSNAIDRGVLQGKLADMMALGQMPKREDLKEIARINREINAIPSTGAYQRFSGAADLKTAAKEFINNPLEITSQLIGESLAAQIRHGYSRALTGAVVGAGAGSVVPGIGTITGAGTGYIAGMGVAGYNLEMASSIMESFREAGVDVTDEKSLTKAFDDPNTLRKAREFANKRAVPVTLFDMFSMGMGGKLLGKPAKTMLGKVGRVAKEVGVQAGLAGAGETTAQVVSGQKINPTAILSEMIGEVGGGAPDIVVGRMIEKKKAGQPIKKEAVQFDAKPEDLQEMLDISEASGEITDAQADEIKKEFEKVEEVRKAVPEQFRKNADIIEAVEQKRELENQKKGLDPVFARKIDEQIKALDTKIEDAVTVGEVAPQAPQTEETLNRYLSTYRRQLAERRKELTEQGIEDIEADEQVKNIKTKISNTQERISKLGEVPPVAEEVRVTTPEAAPQVPAAPEIETKRADIERRRQEELSALIPQQKQAKGKLDFSAAFSGWLGRDLYEKVFNALQKGETTVAGIKEPLIGEAKPYFEKGLIKSAEDVFKYVNGKDINAKYDAELADLSVGEVAPEAAPEVPAAPVEEELPFGEVAPREAVETKEERNLTKRALNIEASTPIGEVFQYFISGGKISPEALTEFFGKERRLGMGKIGVEERRSRTSLTNKNAPSIEALAEKIAGTDRLDQVQEYREAIEEALLNHSGTKTMAEELVRDYDVDFTEMKRAAELEELGKEVEAETQAFVSQIPAAQQQEIMRVLDRFRGNDGFIDWKQIDEEIKGGFEPVLLELSEPSQKIINDAIKQFSETGRVGRISPEVISEEKIKEVKPETYAIQKPTAGEVPVQPEAGVSRKVEEGKPSTKPEEAPEEGKAEGKKVIPPVPPKTPKAEEEAEYTPRERNKALLDKLFKAKDIPEDAKLGLEKEGLRYQTKSQKEAELVAKGIIDEIGIDEALQLADSFEFDGDVNSLIYAESLNRLAKMEREAKSPEQKKALAKKFAEVGIEYDLKSRYGGRFNAAINYFYEKSPLGIVIMEDTKRREEFNKFASGKEQSWKEAHDIIKAELDALKIELAGKKTDPSIRTSEAKIEAARKKRAAIKEKYKKGKGGGLTLTTGGLTKEGIEYVGELVATYIQEGVANVEVIVQKIFLDFKDVLGKSLDEGTAKQIEEEVRKNYKDTKGKSVLDRVRKKLSKLSKKKQDEVIRKSFNQIIEAGALDYDDFRKIIAEVAGYSELTDQEKVRFEELVTKVNAVERAAEKARNERTEKSLKDFQKAEFEASKASQELNKLVWNKPDILKRLVSIMQLSTLGIAALINNPVYNMWNQATLRFPIGLVNDLIDRGVTLAAQETGTEYQREYNSLETQQEFFKKLGLGSKESFEQLVTGLSRQDYIQKEVGSQQIQPFQAAKDWWAAFTGKKNLTTAQVWDKFIQATAGLPAEAVARALNVGDKPQRFAAEGAQAAAFSKSLGLKDIDYELFIQFPQEEAYRAYKSKGFSDAEAAQKAQYVKDVIIKEGQRSTFQQDNLVNTALSAVFNVTFGRGKETGLANLVKATTVSPFIKIPINAFWSWYNLLNPEVALLQSFIHGGRAFYINKTGEKYNAKLALRESRYWLGHFIVGVAIKAVVIALVKAGVYNAGSDEEESKREREGKAFYEGQGTVNIDKLNAVLSGQDPTQVKEGLLIPNRWFGQWGTMGNAIARKYENMTPEQRKNEADYYDFMLGELSTDVLQEMEQGVFSNTSSLLSALNTGNPNRYFTNTLNMLTNIVHPATFAQLSRADLPNYTTQKADTFLKELENSMLTRSTFIRELTGKYPPSKVSIWGDPIAKQGGTVQKLFNITRVNKDMFARPLYDDAKKYNDINFFPPAVTSSLDGKQLTVAQTRTLQEFVGQARKERIEPYINDSAKLEGFNIKYSDLKDSEDKKKVLNYLYEVGREDGLKKFYNQYKDLKPKEKQKDFVKELQFDLFKTLQKYKRKNK